MSDDEKWEVVYVPPGPDDDATYVMRFPVPGGWLYRVQDYDGDNKLLAQNVCFVPDEN